MVWSQPSHKQRGDWVALRWNDYRTAEGNASAAVKVLYVVYSDSNFYNNRVQWVLSTWAKDIPRAQFLVIGDVEPTHDIGARVRRTPCEAHSHSGACCKVTHAVLFAREELQKNQDLKWVYFLDDDVYVRKDALHQLLAAQPQTDASSKGVALGDFTCGYTKKAVCADGELCGGGGVLLDRKAVFSVAGWEYGTDGHSFEEEMSKMCQKCDSWGDISVSSTFPKVGLVMKRVLGLRVNLMTKPCLDDILRGQRGWEPIMFHYASSQHIMQMYHRLFSPSEEETENPVVPAKLRSSQCVTYRSRTVCAQSTLYQDAPWDRYALCED